MSKRTYETIRQGDKPTRSLIMNHVSSGTPSDVVAEVKAISYTGTKDGQVATWRHVFGMHNGSRAHLLYSTENKKAECKAPRIRGGLATLGRVIDMELVGGGRLITPALWACSDEKGHLVLASTHDIRISIEARPQGPRVDYRGIVE